MLGGIRKHLNEKKALREQKREEERARRELALARQAEEEREKKALKTKILAILQEGKVPDMTIGISVPFKLAKNERWLLAFNNIEYAEIRTKRQIHGRSAGASVRVMKGVSLRTGASRGTAVETDTLTPRGRGTFALSTRYVYFHGERSFRIALDKIVSAQGTRSMGLELVRDRASAQPEYFGFHEDDATFIAELIHLLPGVASGKGEVETQSVESYVLPFGDLGADDMLNEE